MARKNLQGVDLEAGRVDPRPFSRLLLSEAHALTSSESRVENEVDEPSAHEILKEPHFDEVIAEWNRFHRALQAGTVDESGELFEQYVAFFNNQVVDHDTDPTLLRKRVLKNLNIHPDRLVISFLG